MLYLFHGTDVAQAGVKARALVDSLRAKKPDASYEKIEADDWDASALQGHLGGQGLFSNKYIAFLDRVTENSEAKEQLIDFIPAMQGSPNIFIVFEGKLKAESKKAFEKSAEKIVECEAKKEAAFRSEFNIFALADAVGNRDSLKAWSIYRQAVDSGMEAEAILGTLFWQAKSMALSADAKSAAEAGLSPFVFTKSKRYASNYSEAELSRLVSGLVIMYHDGHRGLTDLELGTEKLLLGLR